MNIEKDIVGRKEDGVGRDGKELCARKEGGGD